MIRARIALFLGLPITLIFAVGVHAQGPPALVETRVKDLGAVAEKARPIVLSPDGGRLAFVVRRDKRFIVVCDGREGPAFDEISWTSPVFSPDGAQVVYEATLAGERRVVLVGREQEVTPGFNPVFSPDGRLCYQTGASPNISFVWGGVVGPSGLQVVLYGSPVFSPDGKRMAVMARGNGEFITVDGKPGPAFQNVRDPVFSPDGKRFAYRVQDDRQGDLHRDERIVLDGKDLESHGEVRNPAFSPDGRRFAYYARDKDDPYLVCDGKRFASWVNGPSVITFSPDSKRMAYTGSGNMWCDGEIVGTPDAYYHEKSLPAWSPDSLHIAFAARPSGGRREADFAVVCDGRPGTVPPAPSGYAETSSGPRALFDSPGWSADGKHLYYVGSGGGRLSDRFVVCDGVKGPVHRQVFLPSGLRDRAGALRFVAIDDGRASLIEVDWPADRTWEDAFKPPAPAAK